MALNDTPAANRTHISFFGKRNAGKSSLLNAVTNQEISIVSNSEKNRFKDHNNLYIQRENSKEHFVNNY